MARRKRLRNNPRDEWEFDLVDGDEAEGLNGSGAKTGSKRGGKRRAGELYDAFAAGSEDESDGEYVDDDDLGGDEREKRLYEESDEGSGKHVIGDDEDDEDAVEGGNEKSGQSETLLRK